MIDVSVMCHVPIELYHFAIKLQIENHETRLAAALRLKAPPRREAEFSGKEVSKVYEIKASGNFDLCRIN